MSLMVGASRSGSGRRSPLGTVEVRAAPEAEPVVRDERVRDRGADRGPAGRGRHARRRARRDRRRAGAALRRARRLHDRLDPRQHAGAGRRLLRRHRAHARAQRRPSTSPTCRWISLSAWKSIVGVAARVVRRRRSPARSTWCRARPDDVPRFSLLAGGGSFGTRKVSAAGSAARGALAGLVSATYLGSDGDFEFEDDNGTLQNPDDDQRTKRKNNALRLGRGARQAALHARGRRRRDRCSPSSSPIARAVPGSAPFSPTTRRCAISAASAYVRFEQPRLADLPVDLSSTGSFVFERERFRDVAGEIGLGSVATRQPHLHRRARQPVHVARRAPCASRRDWTSAARSSRRTTLSPPTRTVPTRAASVSISPPATRWASSVIACSCNRASAGSTSTTTSAAACRGRRPRSCGRAGAAADHA